MRMILLSWANVASMCESKGDAELVSGIWIVMYDVPATRRRGGA